MTSREEKKNPSLITFSKPDDKFEKKGEKGAFSLLSKDEGGGGKTTRSPIASTSLRE